MIDLEEAERNAQEKRDYETKMIAKNLAAYEPTDQKMVRLLGDILTELKHVALLIEKPQAVVTPQKIENPKLAPATKPMARK